MSRFTIEFGAMVFALGFLPGFIYIFNLFLTRKGKTSSLNLLYSMIVGLIASWISFTLGANFLSNNLDNKILRYSGYIVYLFVIELLLIPIHYFSFRKRSKKNLAEKKKA